MMFSPQLGKPSHARLRDMQRRPFFCWNCSSVGHSYSAPSEQGQILKKMKASCLLMNQGDLSTLCQGQKSLLCLVIQYYLVFVKWSTNPHLVLLKTGQKKYYCRKKEDPCTILFSSFFLSRKLLGLGRNHKLGR